MYTLPIQQLEQEIGGILSVRRSYYQPTQVNALLSRVQQDHAVGRFPLVSTKLPGTWADVAAGKYDAWLGGLLTITA